MSRSSTSQYKWLYDKLLNGKYTIDDLIADYKKCYNKDKTKRTIYRWIEGISLDYGVIVVHDENKRYFVADKGMLKQYDTEKWIAYTREINDLIIKHEDIKDKILFDKIPSKEKHKEIGAILEDILNAISGHLVIKFKYTKYSDSNSKSPEQKERIVHPYCVKYFENRWYFTGFCVKSGNEPVNAMRTFSIDMVKELEFKEDKHPLKREKFKPDPKFNASEYFANVYGIITGDNSKEVVIRLRVSAKRANYFSNLEFHKSQKKISESPSFTIYEYKLKPARDFYQALLHLGPDVEVLSPESVRNEMKKLIQEMAEKYE